MAPIKRKGNAAEEVSVRQPQKRVRVGADDRKSEKKQKNASDDSKPKSDAPKASELSVLRDDEPSFPRGGGSVLTPLERKQIQIQATKDVLFEQKGAKPSSSKFEGGEFEEDTDMEDAGETAATAGQASRKKKVKGKKQAEKDAQEKGIRIEGLNFKVSKSGRQSENYVRLQKSATCSRQHGPRPSFKYQRSQHRTVLAQQPYRLCAPNLRVATTGGED